MRSDNYNTKQKDLIIDIIKNEHKQFTIKDIYERLEGKSQLLVQPTRPCHRWWRHSMKFYFIGLLGGCRFFSLQISIFDSI